jgi:hypothetical protein
MPRAASKKGKCIQVEEYPRSVISRHANWGFTMGSVWVFYTSFPMPARGIASQKMELDDASLAARLEEWQHDETTFYNGTDSDDESEDDGLH